MVCLCKELALNASCRSLSCPRAPSRTRLSEGNARGARAYVLLWLVLCCLCGCSQLRAKTEGTYTTMLQTPIENAEKAKQLNTKALADMRKGDLEKSEKLLKAALVADVNYAPAHNNLGQIYLQRHQLYLAAWEFEFATSLMPEKAEPYLNLGLVYETAGQLHTAKEYYLQAQAISPQDPQVIGCLARIFVKLDDDPIQTAYYLQQVVMHQDNNHWSKWARELLETKYRAPRDHLDQAAIASDPLYRSESIDVLDARTVPIERSDVRLNPSEAFQMPQQSRGEREWVPAVEQPAPVIKAPKTNLSD